MKEESLLTCGVKNWVVGSAPKALTHFAEWSVCIGYWIRFECVWAGTYRVIRHALEALDLRAFDLLNPQPSEATIQAYDNALMDLKPWQSPPPSPWPDYSKIQLPGPIWTFMEYDERKEILLFTRVYGGRLRDGLPERELAASPESCAVQGTL